MKKAVYIFIFVCLIIISGCANECEKSSNQRLSTTLSEVYSKVDTFYNDSIDINENFTGYSLDDDHVIVFLADNSEDKQQEFISKVKVDLKYIEFRQGKKARTSPLKKFDFRIYKLEYCNAIRFNLYYKGIRNIYMSGDIGEFYIILDNEEKTLKEYIDEVGFTTVIDKIIGKMNLEAVVFDGGSAMYSSKEKDVRIIACNRIKGSKNIYIGSYSLKEGISLCEE